MKGNLGIGLIVGNRGFFPDHLCKSGREKLLKILGNKNVEVITLSEKDSKLGSVESWEDVQKCAALFKKNRERLSGIVVTLPNFGDERGVADTIRLSELEVPVLIHAWPDERDKMDVSKRRDSFCGKISVCNNLAQYGIKFTLTSSHTVDPESNLFSRDIDKFLSICRIVEGLKNVKLGAIGTRPGAFKTVRYSEKILEKYGISVDTIDLSEIFAQIEKLQDQDAEVKAHLSQIENYTDTSCASSTSLVKMAKLKIVLSRWVKENDLSGVAVQCWLSMQENYGIMPCTVMSMFSNAHLPAACEVDITGVLSMYILQLASESPSAIVDWNNNYSEEENKAVTFHCSNLPVHFFKESKMYVSEIIANNIGKENAYGTISGRIKSGPFTFLRLTTDDFTGRVKGYTGEGRFTNDRLQTFGGYGVVEIEHLQRLLHLICEKGFEHHVTVNLSQTSEVIKEALEKYKGWEIYRHPVPSS